MRIFKFILIGLLLYQESTYSITVDSVDSLVRVMQELRVTSIDDLLQTAISDKSVFTLVHDSKSMQRGDVDRVTPRTIMMLAGGYVTLGFTGKPDGRYFNSLEVLGYVPEQSKFELARIEFTANQPFKVIKNPPSCLSCHGSDPTPLWSGYNSWTGVYGRIHDKVTPDMEDDYLPYKIFFENRTGRYTHLPWLSDLILPPYSTNDVEFSIDLSRRPNSTLGLVWARQITQRVVRKTLAAPGFELHWRRLLAARLHCKGASFTGNDFEIFLKITKRDWNMSTTHDEHYVDGVTSIGNIYVAVLAQKLAGRLPEELKPLVLDENKRYSVRKELTSYSNPTATRPESLVWADAIDHFGGYLKSGDDLWSEKVCRYLGY